jgi:hypothetical protein
VTNFNSDVLTPEPWRSLSGAFCPRSTFLGTGVPGAGIGAGLPAVVRSVPRDRVKAAAASPVPQPASTAQLGQANNYNHMTSVYAIGEGASGPPPYREPV